MPYETKSRYACNCAETGRKIAKGERCVYYPQSRMVYHEQSKTAQKFRSEQFDRNMLNLDY